MRAKGTISLDFDEARTPLLVFIVIEAMLAGLSNAAYNLFRSKQFYDLLCVTPYGDERLALFIGDAETFEAVTSVAWEKFCADCALSYPKFRKRLAFLAHALPTALTAEVALLNLETSVGHGPSVRLAGCLARRDDAAGAAPARRSNTARRPASRAIGCVALSPNR